MAIPSKLISEPLQTERQSNGKRVLTRELVVVSYGETITVPVGFTTDFSSYPRVFLVMLLTLSVFLLDHFCKLTLAPLLFLLILLIPRFSRVDVAGVVHDYLYATGSHSKWHADKIWFCLSRSGRHHAFFPQAVSGWFFGLFIFGWIAWYRHRWNDQKH